MMSSFMLSGPEVFTPIFLQFLPKTRLAKYDRYLEKKVKGEKVHVRTGRNGLFRQNLNGTGTGTGNLTKTNGFLDIMLFFHTATYVGT